MIVGIFLRAVGGQNRSRREAKRSIENGIGFCGMIDVRALWI